MYMHVHSQAHFSKNAGDVWAILIYLKIYFYWALLLLNHSKHRNVMIAGLPGVEKVDSLGIDLISMISGFLGAFDALFSRG